MKYLNYGWMLVLASAFNDVMRTQSHLLLQVRTPGMYLHNDTHLQLALLNNASYCTQSPHCCAQSHSQPKVHHKNVNTMMRWYNKIDFKFCYHKTKKKDFHCEHHLFLRHTKYLFTLYCIYLY